MSKIIKLTGEDLRHYEKGIKGYYLLTVRLESINKLDEIIDRIKEAIPCMKRNSENTIIELVNKENMLIPNIKTNKDALNNIKITDYMYSYSYNIEKKELYLIYNHGVVDGINCFKILTTILDKDPSIYDMDRIELTKKKMFLYSLKANPLNLLKYEYKKKQTTFLDIKSEPTAIEFIIDINIIRGIKKKYNLSFNTAYCFYLLSIIDEEIRGVIITNIKYKESKNYNNYGIIPFKYEKGSTIKNLDSELKKNMIFSIISPVLFTLKNYLNKLYKNIDLVFSSIPLSKYNPDITLCGNKVTDLSLTIPYHSAPVYIFSTRIGEKFKIMVSTKYSKVEENFINYLERNNLSYNIV